MRRLVAALVLAAVLPGGAALAREPTIKDRRLAACFEDMQRLCAGYPTKPKLKSCIRPKRRFVSATCRAWLDAPG